MKVLLVFYQLVCYLLALAAIALFVLAIGSAIFLGGIINFDDPATNMVNREKYFTLINLQENVMFLSFALWCILTMMLMLTKAFNPKSFFVKIGILGFAFCIIYLIWDPFGLINYLTN